MQLYTYPPITYKSRLKLVTPERDLLHCIGAIAFQQSVLGLYTSHSEWIANKEPPPLKTKTRDNFFVS